MHPERQTSAVMKPLAPPTPPPRIMVHVLQPLELAVAHPSPLSVKRDNLTAEHLAV
jgi:hypothetical protein